MMRKLCCLDTEICGCKCLGLTRNKNVKIGYITILLLACALLLLTDLSTRPHSDNSLLSYGCNDEHLATQQARQICVDDKNTQIIFSGVAVMHLVIMGCMFLNSQKVKVFNEGIWIIKGLFIALAALLLRLAVASTFFDYLSYFGIWAANFLYLFEAIVFVDLVYAFNITLDEDARMNSKFHILKAILATTIGIGSSFLCFLSFQHNPAWVCWANAIALVLFLLLALLRIFPENSILVAVSISLCLNILGCYVEEKSSHPYEYNVFLESFKLFFLIVLLFGMLCQGSNQLRTRKSTLNQLLALNTTASEEDNRYVSSNKWTVYHYVMMMIAVTIPAVFCWDHASTQPEVANWLWINKLVWWSSVLVVYLWSILSSKIFPEQDFSDLENYFRQYQLK